MLFSPVLTSYQKIKIVAPLGIGCRGKLEEPWGRGIGEAGAWDLFEVNPSGRSTLQKAI